jgi:segregation and condensation protein A
MTTETAGNSTSQLQSHKDLLFRLPAFEGPLDLLLHLIKENKIDIYDIPIAIITQQYIDYIELMKELNLDIAGEFLVMAATLVQIKSRVLLPPEETESEEPVEDPRAELVQRLLEYKAFKEASSEFRVKESVWRNIFTRMPPGEEDVEIGPELSLSEVSLFDLLTAFKNILAKAPGEVIEITREKLTVADRINFIMEKLEGENRIPFEGIFEQNFTKISLIVTFLALLEIIRLGLVTAYQEKAFGSIWIMNSQKSRDTEEPSPVAEGESIPG